MHTVLVAFFAIVAVTSAHHLGLKADPSALWDLPAVAVGPGAADVVRAADPSLEILAANPLIRTVGDATSHLTRVCAGGVCEDPSTSALRLAAAKHAVADAAAKVGDASAAVRFADAKATAEFAKAIAVAKHADDAAKAKLIDVVASAKLADAGAALPALKDANSAKDDLAAAEFTKDVAAVKYADAVTTADFARAVAAGAKNANDAAWATGLPVSRLMKDCSGGICKIVEAASLVTDPISASRSLAAAKFAVDAKFANDAAWATGLPVSRLMKDCSGGICKIVEAASIATDPISASRSLAAAKFAADAKFANDAAWATGLPVSGLVKDCSGGICKIVEAASLVADPISADRSLAAAKIAANARYAEDAVLAAGIPVSGLVRDCSGGICKIVDAASLVADPISAARSLAAAKFAAGVKAWPARPIDAAALSSPIHITSPAVKFVTPI